MKTFIFLLFLLLNIKLQAQTYPSYSALATWTPSLSANIINYALYYSSNSAPFTFVGKTNGLSLNLIGLPFDTTNRFIVRAVNSSGLESLDSNIATNYVPKPTVPQIPLPPSNLQIKPISSSSIQLNWQDNATNETFYAIERGRDTSNMQIIRTIPPNTTTFTDYKLHRNRTYYYRVNVCNDIDCSESPIVFARTFR